MAVTLYMTGDSIGIAVGSGSAKKTTIKTAYRYPVTEGGMLNGIITDQMLMADALRQCFAQFKLPKRIRLIIDSGKIMGKMIQIPYMNDREIISVISREFMDADRQNQVFDYLTFSEKPENELNSIFAVAVEKELIESYTQLLASIGISVTEISVGFADLLHLCLKTKLFSNETCILLVREGFSVISVLFENGEFITQRRNRLFQKPGTPEAVAELGQVLSALQQFQTGRQTGQTISKVYLAGFTNYDIEACREHFALFDMNCQVLDQVPGVQFPAQIQTKDGLENADPGTFLFQIGNLMK